MRRRIFTIPALLAGAIVFAAFGCRDAVPVTSSFAGPAFSRGSQGTGTPSLVACAAHDSASTSAWVGARGASIKLGGVHLVIPGNALSDSVLITVTIPADTLAEVQFAPEGLQFSKDVRLLLSTARCSLGGQSPAHVVYLDDAGHVLETLDGVFNGGQHTVTTTIHHFSSYAIAL